jgi:hypothetical protein
MRAEKTLGIIVNSNRYFGFVEKLADAALDQEKQVRIHLLGSGCEFIKTDACRRLSRLTLCVLTAQQNTVKPFDYHQPGVAVVPPQELSLILQDCYRYVVF